MSTARRRFLDRLGGHLNKDRSATLTVGRGRRMRDSLSEHSRQVENLKLIFETIQ